MANTPDNQDKDIKSGTPPPDPTRIVVSSDDKGLYESLISFLSEVVGTTTSWRILLIRMILFSTFGLVMATVFFLVNAKEDLLDLVKDTVFLNRRQQAIRHLPVEEDSPYVRALRNAALSLEASDYGIVRYITPSTESYVYVSDPDFFKDLGYELNSPSSRGDISRQIFTSSVFDECSIINLREQLETANPRIEIMIRRGWGTIVSCPFSDRYGATGHVFLVLDAGASLDSNEAVRLLRGVARPISYHLY